MPRYLDLVGMKGLDERSPNLQFGFSYMPKWSRASWAAIHAHKQRKLANEDEDPLADYVPSENESSDNGHPLESVAIPTANAHGIQLLPMVPLLEDLWEQVDSDTEFEEIGEDAAWQCLHHLYLVFNPKTWEVSPKCEFSEVADGSFATV
ncbi:hypothetical protein K439DRAFT_1622298 [Ramaria rubella]|nr:hypothetical protein K439DRAFT_1622298 [Ramaria rubella]